MHPAPSVIVFTVLSGLGFGFLAYLGLGLAAPVGATAFWVWALGYAFAVAGLMASTLHLQNPRNAWRAFSQWRSSWLSREGWAAVITLVVLAPVALTAIFLRFPSATFGLPGAALALATVYCTSMIYTQLRTVPRWNLWITPVMFLGFALTGGAILAGLKWPAIVLCLALAAVLAASFVLGDRRLAESGSTLESATGLGRIGKVRLYEGPHTGTNYLMREMIHVVGRRHAQKLRVIAVVFAALLPALVLLIAPGGSLWAIALAVVLHLTGAFAARWLFFAEAEHVVGLYYGAR
ncbi:dimethyl sulfoxide reductase anchor subunit family protein [Acidimangrovimonas sediminis]|uniref:dimethyl sulfoxide reductase anchor subunit family protein n=1 Tax=Acidimangrovimonas sediminis TaxID=2056283 RepID=UPI000C802AA2|nr:DmsC/YnfH family molybdoenzyme membrane anchor subunit [Acidimangrovimonas sediminis]